MITPQKTTKFRVTDPLLGESTGHRLTPSQRPVIAENASMSWRHHLVLYACMMTSSNGIIFRVTGHLCGEFTGPRWIPRTKASDAEHWYFLWSAAWINGWVNNGEAGDLRRNRSHYDVIVMVLSPNSFCLSVRTVHMIRPSFIQK